MTDNPDEPARRGKAARNAIKTAPASDGDAAGARPFVEHHLEQAGDWLSHLGRVQPDPDFTLAEAAADSMPMHG